MANQSRFQVFLAGLVGAAIIFPVMLLLNRFGRPELESPVSAALLAVGLATRGRWELRGNFGSGSQ